MKSVEGSTVEPYQDPLLYEDITEPKAAYWDAAKRVCITWSMLRMARDVKPSLEPVIVLRANQGPRKSLV